jgi:hypothetical protein
MAANAPGSVFILVPSNLSLKHGPEIRQYNRRKTAPIRSRKVPKLLQDSLTFWPGCGLGPAPSTQIDISARVSQDACADYRRTGLLSQVIIGLPGGFCGISSSVQKRLHLQYLRRAESFFILLEQKSARASDAPLLLPQE